MDDKKIRVLKSTSKNIVYLFLLSLIILAQHKIVLAEILDNEQVEKETSICEKLNGEGDDWVDEAHTFLSIQFCEPSVWFDSFFSDERFDEEVRAGTRVRWQHDYVLTEGGKWEYTSNIRASFKLPKAKKSINLIFEGEEEETLHDIVPANREEAKGDLGLLYEITESERAKFSVRIKLSPSITFRYRYRKPVSESFTAQFTQEWFRRDNADGTMSRLDFEKKIYDNFLLRQSNTVMHSESYDGKEWANSLVLYQHLSDKDALSYESSVNGVTKPDRYTKNTRIGVRYRKNFYRKWLFYEIAPAINWSKPLFKDERIPIWEILFRLEINFINF